MAAKRWYLTISTGGTGGQLSETAQSAATHPNGWVVGTGTTNHSEFTGGTGAGDRASTTFTGTTVPDGTPDFALDDFFETPVISGDFASANWTFQFAVISTVQAGAADGQIVFRLVKIDWDGQNPVEITSAQQSASVCTNVAGTDVNGTLTFNPGAISLSNQRLCIQVAWKRTGAGGMTTTNIRLRAGVSASVGTTILSSDFTLILPASQNVTNAHIASTVLYPYGAAEDSTPFLVAEGSHTHNAELGKAFGSGQKPAAFYGDGVPVTWLSAVELLLARVGSPSSSMTVEIRAQQSGATLGTSAAVVGSTIPGSNTWIRFTFATPVRLQNIQWRLVPVLTGGADASNYYHWALSTDNLFAYGFWGDFGNLETWDGMWKLYQRTGSGGPRLTYTQTVTPTFISSGSALSAPTVEGTAGPPDQGVTTEFISSGSASTPPSVAQTVTLAHIQSSLTYPYGTTETVWVAQETQTLQLGWAGLTQAYEQYISGHTGWLSSIEIKMRRVGTPTSFIFLKLRDRDMLVAGTPVLLGTTDSFDGSTLSNVTLTWIKLTFPTPIRLEGRRYTIEQWATSVTVGNYYNQGITTDVYAGGGISADESLDLTFRLNTLVEGGPSVTVGTTVTTATIAPTSTLYPPAITIPALAGFRGLLAFWMGGASPGAGVTQDVVLPCIGGGDALLQEDGAELLLEDGGTFLLETYPGTSQVFAPTVALDTAQNVGLDTIPSTSSATGPTVSPQAVGITAGTVTTTIAVNVPTVIPQTVTVTGAHIGSTVTVGAPAIVVMPGHVATTATLFAPTIVPQAVSVTAGTRPLTSSAFAPTVVPQAVTIVAGTVALTSLVREPTVIPQAVGVTAGTVAATTVVRVPTVIPQAVGITAGTVAAADQRFVPTVAPGAVAVTAGTIASTSQTNVATVTVGPVAVLMAHIALVVSLFVPAISQVAPGDIGGQNVPTTVVVNAPSVVGGLATINVPAIALTSLVAAPTIAVGPTSVTGGTIATTAQSFAPMVVPQAVGITAGHVATTNQRFAPTVAAGAVTVLAPTVASTVLLNPPTVVGAGAVVTAPLASSVVLNSPTLTVSAVSVTAQTVAATSQVFIPTVAVGVTEVSGATVGTTAQVFAPAMIARLDGTFIASTSQLFPPTVIVTQSVTTASVPTGIALFAPSLLPVEFVTTAHVASAAVLRVPTIAVGPATVVTGTIGSGSSATAPSQVLPGAVTITTPPLTSTAQTFAPTLTAGLTAGHVPSGIQLFLPSLAAGPVTQLGATIDSTHVVFAPSLGAGISTAPIGSTSLTFAPTLTGIVVTPAWVITTELFPPSALPLGEMLGPTIPSGSVAFAPQMVAYAPPPEILDFVSNLVREVDGEVVLCRGLDGTVILTRAVSVSATVDRVLEMSPSLVRRVVEVGSER